MSDGSVDPWIALEKQLVVDEFFTLLTFDGDLDEEFITRHEAVANMDEATLFAVCRRLVLSNATVAERNEWLVQILKMHLVSGCASWPLVMAFSVIAEHPLMTEKWHRHTKVLYTTTKQVNGDVPQLLAAVGACLEVGYEHFADALKPLQEGDLLSGNLPSVTDLIPRSLLEEQVHKALGALYGDSETSNQD